MKTGKLVGQLNRAGLLKIRGGALASPLTIYYLYFGIIGLKEASRSYRLSAILLGHNLTESCFHAMASQSAVCRISISSISGFFL